VFQVVEILEVFLAESRSAVGVARGGGERERKARR